MPSPSAVPATTPSTPTKQAAGGWRRRDSTAETATPKPGARASAALVHRKPWPPIPKPQQTKPRKDDPESDARFQGTVKRLNATCASRTRPRAPQDKVDDAKAAVKAPAEEPQSHAANDKRHGHGRGCRCSSRAEGEILRRHAQRETREHPPQEHGADARIQGKRAAREKLKQAVGTQIKAQKDRHRRTFAEGHGRAAAGWQVSKPHGRRSSGRNRQIPRCVHCTPKTLLPNPRMKQRCRSTRTRTKPTARSDVIKQIITK